MSFNQYRTNPGQAVSNFKGRTDTPKAWPSTAVSAWMNGGLFGGGGKKSMEEIAVYTADGTGQLISFQNIPQTYRNLRIVLRSARTAAYGSAYQIHWNNNSTISLYNTLAIGNGNSASYIEGAKSTSSRSPTIIGDTILPTESTGYWVWDVPNYCTVGTYKKARVSLARIGAKGTNASGGFQSLFQQSYGSTTAISRIDIAQYGGAAASNYLLKVPMTATLYGIGTAE